MTASTNPDSDPGWTDDQLDRLIRQLDVARLNDDFERAGWHCWLSTPSPGRQPRVCTSRAFPTHPHDGADPDLSRKFTGCGETLDTGTAAEMRALLTERAAS